MICLVFADIAEKVNETDGTKMSVSKKVLFKTNMDRFEAFEMKGLFDYFKSRNDLKVWALSNGVRTRETYMKLQGGVAPILNLVVKMNNGILEQMEWRNDCLLGCAITDCKTYEFEHPDLKDIRAEKNCFIRSCESSKGTPECDSKVYVTWIGNDEDRYCISDNMRITNFKEHSIQSYFESATKTLAAQTNALIV